MAKKGSRVPEIRPGIAKHSKMCKTKVFYSLGSLVLVLAVFSGSSSLVPFLVEVQVQVLVLLVLVYFLIHLGSTQVLACF